MNPVNLKFSESFCYPCMVKLDGIYGCPIPQHTYKNPTKNLVIRRIILDVAKLEAIEKVNPQNNADLNTFNRPQVSDLM